MRHEVPAAERWLAAQLALTRVLAESATPAEAIPRVLATLAERFDFDGAVYWACPPGPTAPERQATWPIGGMAGESSGRDGEAEAEAILVRRVRDERRPRVVEAAVESRDAAARALGAAGVHLAVAVPVRLHDEVLGVVELRTRRPIAGVADLVELLATMGCQLGSLLERKRFEERANLLACAVEQSASLVLISDASGRIEYVNPEFCRETGYSADELIGNNPRLLKSGKTPAAEYEDLWKTITAGRDWHGEFHNRKKDGSHFWSAATISPVRDAGGHVAHFVAIQEVITELKQRDEQLREANERLERRVKERTVELERANASLLAEVGERHKVDRALRALSQCSQALIRATDEDRFLRELCRIIVEEAGYRFCWVGYAMNDESRSVRPMAFAGHESGYLAGARVSWADVDRGRGPTGTSIRTGRTFVVRDVANDERFAPWREPALKRGYLSVIGIPLISPSGVLGALTIYAAEPNAFDREEVGLLEQLSRDLTYGVLTLRTRAERSLATEALRRAFDELERRVEERTADLKRLNEKLTAEVAERRRVEAALRDSERLYRQLNEGTRDAIVVTDQLGRITLFNPAARRTFGYDEAEALGQPVTLLMPPGMRVQHEQAMARYLDTREPRSVGRTVELTGRRKNGELFPLEISLSAIELPDGLVFLGAIRDLTDRRRLQAMVVQAEKLASLGLLSAGVAHEINNPIAYVGNNLAVLDRELTGLLQMLDLYDETGDVVAAHRPDLARRVEQLADEIDLPYVRENLGGLLASTRKGVKRVSEIVQNLRGFARLDQAAVDRLDLHVAVGSSLELIRGELAKRAITVVQHGDDPAPVVCAPAQINQVVLNLLVNAMQAIEETGRPDGRIEITARVVGGETSLEVRDNGCGIPDEARSRIFDPFFTTKPVGRGTGLGLAISQGIVADHGGRLEVESEPGVGTCFRLVLPADGRGMKRESPAPPVGARPD